MGDSIEGLLNAAIGFASEGTRRQAARQMAGLRRRQMP
jgi:hypothetical protein